MGSLSEGMGIGDFALSMLGQKDPTHSSPKKSGGQLDIENVAVSQEQRNAILEETFGISIETPKPKVDEEALLEERKKALKEEFMATAARLKELVAEMASVGMTSTGQLGVGVQRGFGMRRSGDGESDRCDPKPKRRKKR